MDENNVINYMYTMSCLIILSLLFLVETFNITQEHNDYEGLLWASGNKIINRPFHGNCGPAFMDSKIKDFPIKTATS